MHTHTYHHLSSNDFGILFHAKEHPREFSLSAGAIHPVGHPLAGGEADPRTGTSTSIFDPNYHLRNFVYLASSHRCYELDPRAASFPHDAIPDSDRADGHFHTVSAKAFGRYVYVAASSVSVNVAHAGIGAQSKVLNSDSR